MADSKQNSTVSPIKS